MAVPRPISAQCRQSGTSLLSPLRRRKYVVRRALQDDYATCLSSKDVGRILESSSVLVGNTPNVVYKTRERTFGTIVCKLEYMNATKSVKDRIAYSMIQCAENSGLIVPGKTTLIEPTSGNTGIALAYIAAARGYRLILTMPESMSMERKLLLRGYGAELVLTPGSAGMTGAINAARQITANMPGAYMLGQFENPANPEVHYRTTGREIWRDTNGKIDYLVLGVGTGGTLTGAGRYLKEQNPNIQIIAVEPAESPVMSGGRAGLHGIPGIGAGFLPETLDRSLVDGIVRVRTQDAVVQARRAALECGILAGISSGAAIAAAIKVAKRPEARKKLIVAILPSSGERYLSTSLFSDLWQAADPTLSSGS